MEWTTLLGLFLGFAAMCGVLLFGKSEASFATFIDPPALMMVFGGAAAVVLVGFPGRQIRNLAAILREPFLAAKDKPAELIDELVQLAEIARKDGLLALETTAAEIRNPFIALGVQLAVDGTRPETVREIMQNEVAKLAARRRQARKVVELVGRCGPAFGMIATLLGLILMLGSLSKPDSVGPAMAIALTGTLYALLANLICIPLAEKLGYLGEEEQIARQIVILGVLAIQAGDNPRVVRQRLEMLASPPLQVLSYTHAVESLTTNTTAMGGRVPAPSQALSGRGSVTDATYERHRPTTTSTTAPPQAPAAAARAA